MEKIFCYLLPFSINDEDIKVAAFTRNIESFAIAFLVLFFFFSYVALFLDGLAIFFVYKF